jgi:hypothetical protein
MRTQIHAYQKPAADERQLTPQEITDKWVIGTQKAMIESQRKRITALFIVCGILLLLLVLQYASSPVC